MWANAPGSRSLDWAGGSGEILGRVHTNGELRFVGAAKTVRGTTTYAGSIAADTTTAFAPSSAALANTLAESALPSAAAPSSTLQT